MSHKGGVTYYNICEMRIEHTPVLVILPVNLEKVHPEVIECSLVVIQALPERSYAVITKYLSYR